MYDNVLAKEETRKMIYINCQSFVFCFHSTIFLRMWHLTMFKH